MSVFDSKDVSSQWGSRSPATNPEVGFTSIFLPAVHLSSAEIVSARDKITPCPLFERLRPSARDDREERYVKRLLAVKRAEEMHLRRALLSRPASMHDYYSTLFVPGQPCWPPRVSEDLEVQPSLSPRGVAPVLGTARSVGTAGSSLTLRTAQAQAATPSPSAVAPALRACDFIREDIEESFIACYYQKNPGALAARRALLEAEAERRRSAAQSGSRVTLRGKSRKSRSTAPPEGSPAPNLRVLRVALLNACDATGLLTRDALAYALAAAPFEMYDGDTIDGFFFAVRASSTAVGAVGAGGGGGGEGGRLDLSVSTICDRPQRSQHHMARQPSMFCSPTSANAAAAAALRGSRPSSATRRSPGTSHGKRAAGMSTTAWAPRGPSSLSHGTAAVVADCIPRPVVRVREVLAAMDELINGPETREMVRALCFALLESDGFIHKSALRALRMSWQESCEGPRALVTPSIVKALGDVFDTLLREEELAYVRAQAKGRRSKAAKKPPALAPHQKSVIPLHMMRRSHIDEKDFRRFFDESPYLAAAFAHVWLPAFFSTTWPPVRRVSYEDTSFGDDNDDELTSEGARSQRELFDKAVGSSLAAFASPERLAQRRGLVRRVVTDRLECMKQAMSTVSEAAV